jgi:citronellol/citronellal dehydrogenase
VNTLKGKTLFITGASRGIGLAIAKRAARDGANIVIAAKTAEPHPRLPGTIHTAAEEIEREGGKALPLMVDIRYEEQLKEAVKQAVERFGGIDILVNNASAISLTGTLETPMKKFDLMFGVNVRGTYATTQACLPELLKAKNPHVLMLSPPLNMKPKWFQNHVAYTMAKYGMSMCVFGMAEEFREQGVAFNALWPRTTIATAAVNMLGGQEMMEASRTPEIMSDAAHAILTRDSRSCTGNFFLDEDLLRESGVTDFAKYLVKPGTQPLPDFFID